MGYHFVGICVLSCFVISVAISQSTEQEAQRFINEMEPKYSAACYKSTVLSWQSSVSISNDSSNDDSHAKFNQIKTEIQDAVKSNFSNWQSFRNPQMRRAFKILSSATSAAASDMQGCRVDRMNELAHNMVTAYSTATVCKYQEPSNCNIHLSDLEHIMQTRWDPLELEHYFTAWHNKISELVPPSQYSEYAGLLNEYARATSFTSEAGRWQESYNEETPDWTADKFEKALISLEQELTPMYQTLHAYVRMKLRSRPDFQTYIKPCGYLPSHLLGNMWAQEWLKLDPITKPFPKAPKLDATEAMENAGYTPLKMFLESDRFFKEMGLIGVFPEFYDKSVIERPPTGQMVCHPTGWDMCAGKNNTDFRIRMCAQVTQMDFYVVHHEMGHLEYYEQYRGLPWMFRTPANPGFGEAVGDAIALAVLTPGHLQCKLNLDLGLGSDFCQKIKTVPYTVTETDINYLFITALDKLVFFPFAMSVDTWRWDVFEGRVNPEEYNWKWWEIRKRKQGIVPPDISRAWNHTLFDPAGKYHVVANVDYVRYFVAGILTFQFYEAMCIASGEYDPGNPQGKPLYMCDFSGSKKAGEVLARMLKLGYSKGWPEALEAITGTREMKVEPFKHYLQPLLDHMEKELRENGEVVGFGDSCEEVERMKKKPLPSVEEIYGRIKDGTLYTK